MSTADRVADGLQLLRQGDFDSAECLLGEVGVEAHPCLVVAYDEERSPSLRVALVRLVWELRTPEALPFLARALSIGAERKKGRPLCGWRPRVAECADPARHPQPATRRRWPARLRRIATMRAVSGTCTVLLCTSVWNKRNELFSR